MFPKKEKIEINFLLDEDTLLELIVNASGI
jgi:hypothetical protein